MREKVKLTSTAGSGYAYYTADTLQFMEYDPKVRKHVLFVESKLPSHSKE
ncbi:MAG: 50S ribosomal protein L33 [Oligoflexia bacterium]